MSSLCQRYPLTACVWLCVAAIMMTSGHVMPDATSAPCEGDPETILKELERINDKLDSNLQAVAQPTSSSPLGSATTMDLIMTNFATLESELKATQAELFVTQAEQKATEAEQRATHVELKATQARLDAAETTLQGKKDSGSTFVRWGRKTCTNSSQVVYTGVAGGSHYTHAGAAVDLLCLTLTPQFEETDKPIHAYLAGAEYETVAGLENQDVPCSVCRAAQSTTIMVAATHACPSGWTAQYVGHLVSGHHSHAAASQYNCLDSEPEAALKGYENKNGKLLYYTAASCGSLPCPPYVEGKTILCVVCSK